MVNPNPNIVDQLFVVTLRNSEKRLQDNMTKNNGLYRYMDAGNRKRTFTGPNIVEQLAYAENQTFTWYSGFELLPTSQSTVFTYAEFSIKQASVQVPFSGLDQIRNSGKEAILDYLAQLITNAENTMANRMSQSMYSLGLGFGGKEIGGLQQLVADDPTVGTVGNINRATVGNEWWRNYARQVDVTSANIVSEMNRAFESTRRGGDKVKVIITDNNLYNLYYGTQTQFVRHTDSRKADGGFLELAFNGIPVINDGGLGGFCPANHMYFLNTDYLFLRPAQGKDMVQSEEVRPSNQDATVRSILWAGNMTISNSSLQGVLVDTAP